MVYRQNFRMCVACGAALENRLVAGNRFDQCPKCEGAWLEERVLASMWSTMVLGERPPALLPRTSGRGPRPCPDCSEPMERVELLEVPIDRCHRHGLWFDKLELETALAGASLPREIWLTLFASRLPTLS